MNTDTATMTQDERSKLLTKLQQILALTNSPVEGEAHAAAAMLQKLLEKHNLDMADLEAKGQQSPGIREGGVDLGKAAFKWKLNLADVIADHYFCWSLTDHYFKTVTFVGRPDNVESLTMLYSWLVDQVKRISAEERREHELNTGEHIDPLRWQVNFGLGAVERLASRLREMRVAASEQAGTQLVIHHRSEISDWLEEQGRRRVDGQESKRDREYRENRDADRIRLAALKETDLEAYYAEVPWDRPLTPEQEAAQALENVKMLKRLEEREKREAKNAKRRQGRGTRVRYMSEGEYQKQLDGETASSAGRKAGDKVNLQPFIGSGSSAEPSRKEVQ